MYCTLPPVTGAAELKVSLVVMAFFAVSSAAMTTQFSPVSPRLDVLGRELDDVLALTHGLVALDAVGGRQRW